MELKDLVCNCNECKTFYRGYTKQMFYKDIGIVLLLTGAGFMLYGVITHGGSYIDATGLVLGLAGAICLDIKDK